MNATSLIRDLCPTIAGMVLYFEQSGDTDAHAQWNNVGKQMHDIDADSPISKVLATLEALQMLLREHLESLSIDQARAYDEMSEHHLRVATAIHELEHPTAT